MARASVITLMRQGETQRREEWIAILNPAFFRWGSVDTSGASPLSVGDLAAPLSESAPLNECTVRGSVRQCYSPLGGLGSTVVGMELERLTKARSLLQLEDRLSAQLLS